MEFANKLRKVVTGDALLSARRHTRGIVHRCLRQPRLTPDEIIASIDPKRFAEIRARYRDPNPTEGPPKYLHLQHWLRVNLDRIRELRLDVSHPLRVLDLGCGAGYFLYICSLLGHNVTGLDLNNIPMFNELIALLGVPRVVARIKPFQPLPAFPHKFDLITGFLVCFNDHSTQPWREAEWNYFLDDAASRLTPNGRLWFELNREADGSPYPTELKRFFASRGGVVDGYRIGFTAAKLARSPAELVAS